MLCFYNMNLCLYIVQGFIRKTMAILHGTVMFILLEVSCADCFGDLMIMGNFLIKACITIGMKMQFVFNLESFKSTLFNNLISITVVKMIKNLSNAAYT